MTFNFGPNYGREFAQLGNSMAELTMSFKHDNQQRENFTKQYVANASVQYPNHNVVISHNRGRISGNYITYQHLDLRLSNGSIGFEIYFSPKGKPFEFVRNGDGGYINWCYSGEFIRKNDNTIVAIVHN